MNDVSLILVRIGMPQWLFWRHLRKFAAFPVSETVWRSPHSRLGERGVAIEAVALGCERHSRGARMPRETGQDDRRTGWEVEMSGGSERLRLLEHPLQRGRHLAQTSPRDADGRRARRRRGSALPHRSPLRRRSGCRRRTPRVRARRPRAPGTGARCRVRAWGGPCRTRSPPRRTRRQGRDARSVRESWPSGWSRAPRGSGASIRAGTAAARSGGRSSAKNGVKSIDRATSRIRASLAASSRARSSKTVIAARKMHARSSSGLSGGSPISAKIAL